MALCTGPFVSTEILVTAERRTAGGHISLVPKEKTSEGFFDVKILPACLIGVCNGVPYALEYVSEYCIKY